MNTDDRTSVQLPAARCDRMLYIRVTQRAQRENLSISRIIRDALEEYCREEDPEFQEAMAGGQE